MNCPICAHPDHRVLRTDAQEDGVRRSRECLKCAHRWHTKEVPEEVYEKIRLAVDAYETLSNAVNGRQRQQRCIATSVYRHYDDSGALLYVGIARRAAVRTRSHARTSPWFVHVVRTDVVEYPSRESALAAELTAIRSEYPIHNIAGKLLP